MVAKMGKMAIAEREMLDLHPLLGVSVTSGAVVVALAVVTSRVVVSSVVAVVVSGVSGVTSSTLSTHCLSSVYDHS